MTRPAAAPPVLTDTHALALHRARAARRGGDGLFLHRLARDEIEERLALVNRAFSAPAIITAFPAIWADLLPNAVILPDDDRLDLRPEAHDLVIHAMALHWANDPVGQLVQCRRALVPDGHFLAVLPGGRTLQELRAALAEAESRLAGGLSPRVAPMAEIRDLGGLLQRAGLALPVADSLLQTATYPSLAALVRDLRDMGDTNALAARLRKTPPRRLFAEAETVYRQAFSTPEGRLNATFELIFLSGWAPHPDQPQPLRPGSASHSLADILARLRDETEH